MLRKIGIPLLALVAFLLVISPPQASAKWHFGVYVGPPVYTYPPAPYVYGYPYSYPYPPYSRYYVQPGYAYPYGYSTYYSWGGRHRRNEWREHEWREHERHEISRYRR